MRKNVLISVKALQFDREENSIEVISSGTCKEMNGTSYIKYDEMLEGESTLTNNLIKVRENCIEVIKTGAVVAHMQFMEGEKTMTYYQTSFGSFYLGIHTKHITIEKSEMEIFVKIEYSMEINYENFAECAVQITIK